MGGRGACNVYSFSSFSFLFLFSFLWCCSMFVFLFFFLPLAFKVGSVHGWGKKKRKGEKKNQKRTNTNQLEGSNGMSEEGGLMEDPFYMHFFLTKGRGGYGMIL